MNKKIKKILKWGLLSSSAIATVLAFSLTAKNNEPNIKAENKNNVLTINGKKVEKKRFDFKDTMFISKNQSKIFKNKSELENYINKNLKMVQVNSLITKEEIKKLEENNVGFLTSNELQNFDFSNSELKNIKVYMGQNNSVHLSETDAKKSYFNLQEFIKIGNFVASSKEDLYNYLMLMGNKKENNDPTIIEKFLEACEKELNKNEAYTAYIKTPNNSLTSINLDWLKNNPNRKEINETLKEIIEKYQQKMVLYWDQTQNKYIVKYLDEYLSNYDKKEELIKNSYTKLYSTKGRNKFIVDNSKEDKYDLFGSYTLSSGNNYIYEITDKNNWTKIESANKNDFYKNIKTQNAADMISNLFNYLMTIEITEDKNISAEMKNEKLRKINPLTDIFDNKENINPFKSSLTKYKIERDGIKGNLYEYLFDVYKRLYQGKKSNFLSNLYVLYVNGISSLIQVNATQKDIIIYKEHFKRIFKEISETVASLLPDVFEHDGIKSNNFSDEKFKKVNLFKEWNIFDGDFDLSTDIYRLVNGVVENKVAFNSLGVLLSAILNSQKLIGKAEFTGINDLMIKKDISEKELEYYKTIFDYYSFTAKNSPFKFNDFKIEENLQDPFIANHKSIKSIKLLFKFANESAGRIEQYCDVLLKNARNKLLEPESDIWNLTNSFFKSQNEIGKNEKEKFLNFCIENGNKFTKKQARMVKRLKKTYKAFSIVDKTVKNVSRIFNTVETFIRDCVKNPDWINSTRGALSCAKDFANLILDFIPIPQAFLAKMIINISMDLILEFIGKHNYFDYEYSIEKGETTGKYIWNGGESILRLWGFWETEENTIKDAKLLRPIKYLDAQIKDEYYFNGLRYSELETEKLREDIINYYKNDDINSIEFKNAIVFNTWQTDKNEIENKINNKLEKGKKIFDKSNLQNISDNKIWFNVEEKIKNLQNYNFDFEDNWIGKLYLTKKGESLTIPKTTDLDFKDSLWKLIENLEIHYYSNLPVLRYDYKNSTFYPVDQFKDNKTKTFKSNILNELNKNDHLKLFIENNKLNELNNSSLLLYSKPFTVKNNFLFWEDNLDLIKLFYNNFNVKSKNVSYIEYLRKDNYERMEMLNKKYLYEFKNNENKYYFINADKARQYIINTFFNVSNYRYTVKSKEFYYFENSAFDSIEDIKKYLISIEKEEKNEIKK